MAVSTQTIKKQTINQRCTKNHLCLFMFVLEECTKRQNTDSCRSVQSSFKKSQKKKKKKNTMRWSSARECEAGVGQVQDKVQADPASEQVVQKEQQNR